MGSHRPRALSSGRQAATLLRTWAGFEEALASSISLQVPERLVVRVASVPGLTLLKLIAWADGGQETNKDVADISRLVTAYAMPATGIVFMTTKLDLFEAVGFDMEAAGAELLGRDVAQLCSLSLLDRVR